MYVYKKNTVIIVAFDSKQKNKTYMLDVSSRKFFYHFENFFKIYFQKPSIGVILGFLGIIALMLMLFFLFLGRFFRLKPFSILLCHLHDSQHIHISMCTSLQELPEGMFELVLHISSVIVATLPSLV